MDTHKLIREKLTSLGYTGELPNNSLKMVCNPATCSIWEQFFNKVKSKQEVETCRKNIIIDSLKENNLLLYKDKLEIKEIKIYNKLQQVNSEISLIQEKILELKHKNKVLKSENTLKFLEKEKLETKIEENTVKMYLLNKRAKILTNEINRIDEMFKVVENNLPLKKVSDQEENIDLKPSESLQMMLQSYSEKLEEIFKINKNTDLISQNFSHDEMLKSVKINRTCFSTLKKPVENTFRTPSCKPLKLNFESLTKKNENSSDILSDSFLDLHLDDELMDKENSVSFNSMTFSETKTKMTQKLPISKKVESDFCSKVLANQEIENCIKDILGNNRARVGKVLEQLRNDHLNKLMCIKISEKEKEKKQESVPAITKLQFIHIKNELQAIKIKRCVSRLEKLLKNENISMEKRLINSGRQAYIPGFKLALKNLELKIKIDSIKKEINNYGKSQGNYQLASLQQEIIQTKKNICTKGLEIREYINDSFEILHKINEVGDSFNLSFKKIVGFMDSIDWVGQLVNDDNFNEVEIFKNFPLKFNAKYLNTDSEMLRKIGDNDVFISHLEDSETIYTLINLINRPQCPIEYNIRDIIRLKNEFDCLKRNLVIEEPYNKKYNFHELQNKENYVLKMSSELSSLINSNRNQDIFNNLSRAKKLLNLQLELPFTKYIQNDKLVDGKTYAEYEKECLSYHENNIRKFN